MAAQPAGLVIQDALGSVINGKTISNATLRNGLSIYWPRDSNRTYGVRILLGRSRFLEDSQLIPGVAPNPYRTGPITANLRFDDTITIMVLEAASPREFYQLFEDQIHVTADPILAAPVRPSMMRTLDLRGSRNIQVNATPEELSRGLALLFNRSPGLQYRVIVSNLVKTVSWQKILAANEPLPVIINLPPDLPPVILTVQVQSSDEREPIVFGYIGVLPRSGSSGQTFVPAAALPPVAQPSMFTPVMSPAPLAPAAAQPPQSPISLNVLASVSLANPLPPGSPVSPTSQQSALAAPGVFPEEMFSNRVILDLRGSRGVPVVIESPFERMVDGLAVYFDRVPGADYQIAITDMSTGFVIQNGFVVANQRLPFLSDPLPNTAGPFRVYVRMSGSLSVVAGGEVRPVVLIQEPELQAEWIHLLVGGSPVRDGVTVPADQLRQPISVSFDLPTSSVFYTFVIRKTGMQINLTDIYFMLVNITDGPTASLIIPWTPPSASGEIVAELYIQRQPVRDAIIQLITSSPIRDVRELVGNLGQLVARLRFWS